MSLVSIYFDQIPQHTARFPLALLLFAVCGDTVQIEIHVFHPPRAVLRAEVSLLQQRWKSVPSMYFSRLLMILRQSGFETAVKPEVRLAK